MKTKIESLSYSNGSFSGDIFSSAHGDIIGFDGYVTYDSSEEEILITEITFAEELPVEEEYLLGAAIAGELASDYTYEVYSDWNSEAYEWYQGGLEDIKMGN